MSKQKKNPAKGNEPLKVLEQGMIWSNCALGVWQPSIKWIRRGSALKQGYQLKVYNKYPGKQNLKHDLITYLWEWKGEGVYEQFWKKNEL